MAWIKLNLYSKTKAGDLAFAKGQSPTDPVIFKKMGANPVKNYPCELAKPGYGNGRLVKDLIKLFSQDHAPYSVWRWIDNAPDNYAEIFGEDNEEGEEGEDKLVAKSRPRVPVNPVRAQPLPLP